MQIPSVEQFSGCLLGECLGDALGFPVEGHGPEACAAYVADMLRAKPIDVTNWHRLPFGQYTDDSQLARELIQSYVARRTFVPEDYAARIAAIFSENRIVGRGLATAKAARRLAAGVPWDAAGEPSPSAGNGSAMRAGPIGLFYFDDPREMTRAAHDQGRITHHDSRCSAGAVAVAGAVALALPAGPVDVALFVDQLTEWVAPFDTVFTACLGELTRWVELPPKEAAAPISRAGYLDDAEDGSPYVWVWITPYVASSVLWSLYAFLRTPEDYWETICTAIAVGGDVDTTAAMAGAISGAHNGLEALPWSLIAALNDQGTWTASDLIQLCNQAYAIKMGTQLDSTVRPPYT